MKERYIPEFQGNLRKHMINIPPCIRQCSGIKIFGKRIKAIIFSTDVAVIKNVDADAVIAVYPFTPQPVINQAILQVADIPVFCGIGGGTTTGKRVVNLAMHAEFQGAIGVVLNAPTANEIVRKVGQTVDIPIIITVVSEKENVGKRLEAGASILNVSAADKTPYLVEKIRREYPEAAIIATGGRTVESIEDTIQAGANAISWTPPTTGELFKMMMEKYRAQASGELSANQ